MGVFGAFFGCRGDAGFKVSLWGASSGVGGFNVATLSRLVREKLRPARPDVRASAKKFALRTHNGPKLAFSGVLGEFFRGRAAGGAVLGEFFSRQPPLCRSWMQRRALQAGCRWGICSIRNWQPACRRRVTPLMTPFPPIGDGETVMFDVCPAVSHAIPLWLFQDLNWHRWNCNDSGGC